MRTKHALIGKPKLFSGRLEVARLRAGKCEISLIPHRFGLTQMIPARVIGPTCGLVYGIAPSPCQIAPATLVVYPTCDHSREACKVRGNLLNFGGEDLIPIAPVQWRVRGEGGG